MASVTKIMTAVVALENAGVDDAVTVSPAVAGVDYASGLVSPGDRTTLNELLEALLIRSGNEVGVAIANHVSGGESRFVALMNRKADELGLADTRFANTHGLDARGHYSSAADLAVLARYAMRNPEFRRIVAEKRAVIEVPGRRQRIENTNVLLSTYEGANGIKTGWTNNAGYCVAASAERDGIELYTVVLGSNGERQRFEQARELLDWGFAHYRPQQLASKGTVIGESVVTDYLDVTVPGALADDSSMTIFDLAGPIDRTVTMADVEAPVQVGDRIGVATFAQGGQIVATVPLVATAAVDAPNMLERAGIALIRLWNRLTGEESAEGSSAALVPKRAPVLTAHIG